MSYRMLEARKLIVSTQEKISVIANMVGYLHMNNFYTPFQDVFWRIPQRDAEQCCCPDAGQCHHHARRRL